MSTTVYRFLPWSRRGLAAALPGGALDAAPIPQRATVAIDVVVGPAGTASTSATLHGPGDVIGLDPTTIVRTTPRANATDVEPNYLVAVDFDQPELPWLFTPQGAPGSGHLRPWLVLVVVRDRAGVSIKVPAGAPLPQLVIESGAGAELPDLADSWAWAHAQLLDSDAGAGTAEAVGGALRDHPDRNVSRLICPRRLEPGVTWLACLVPAFDAGVRRGLGQEPAAGAPLGPAWQGPDAVTLPLYFHWQFTTGPAGDFESLARRVKPFKATTDIGRVKMHVGDAAPPLRLPEGDAGRFLDMDGALRAPALADGTLAQVPKALKDGLAGVSRLVADAADGRLDGVAPGDEVDQPLGPPVYASFIRRQHVVDATDKTWFGELNLDPRPRVAAGLGAEILRSNQEEIVQAAWEQVGSVLEAEAALSRARLGLEAARRFHERHLQPQPKDRLLQLAAPLAGRTPFEQVTVAAAIRPTSMPDRSLDGALRRLTAPTGRVMSTVARRIGVEPGVGLRSELVASLAVGTPGVDPGRFEPVALTGMGDARPVDQGNGMVSLEPLGLPVTIPAAAAKVLVDSSVAIGQTAAPEGADRLRVRPDLRSVGLLTESHLDAARVVAREAATVGAGDAVLAPDRGTDRVLDDILTVGMARPGAAGFLLDPAGLATEQAPVHALELGPGGALSVRSPATGVLTPVATISPSLRATTPVGAVVNAIPRGALPSPAAALPAAPAPAVVLRAGPAAGGIRVVPGPVAGPVVGPVVGPVGPGGPVVGPVGPGGPVAQPPVAAPPTVSVGPLLTDSAALTRYEAASAALADVTAIGVVEISPSLKAFDLAAAATTVLQRTDPLVSHAARRDSLVSFAGVSAGRIANGAVIQPGWRIAPLVDRVMAYPVLDLPAYTMLAAYDRTRFCPGIDEVPPDSVTLLETNPRFIAAFMAGLNHETNRELLWRRYPTDQRGTPFRRFWERLDGQRDIPPMNEWTPKGSLAQQTSDPLGNLVLLLRGQLLRRYPNTVVVAIRALGPRKPSEAAADVKVPVFSGRFDPDVTFYGFPLQLSDVTTGEGWFFALMEPPTEPRFGLDEEPDSTRGPSPSSWDDAAWSDLPTIQPGGHLPLATLAALLPNTIQQADGVAAALFQRPFELLVLGRHLVLEE